MAKKFCIELRDLLGDEQEIPESIEDFYEDAYGASERKLIDFIKSRIEIPTENIPVSATVFMSENPIELNDYGYIIFEQEQINYRELLIAISAALRFLSAVSERVIFLQSVYLTLSKFDKDIASSFGEDIFQEVYYAHLK